MAIHTTVQVGLYIMPMSQMLASHYDEPTQRKTYSTEQFPTEQDMRQQIDSDLKELLAKHQAVRPNDRVKAQYIVLDVAPTPKRFYPTGGVNWIDKAFQYNKWRNGTHEGWELDEPVKWTNSYGVCWESNIFGFDTDGEAVLYSDCYWVTKPVGHLTRLEPTESNAASVTLEEGGRLHEKWAATEFVANGDQIDIIDSPRREDVERYIQNNIDPAEFCESSKVYITLNGIPVDMLILGKDFLQWLEAQDKHNSKQLKKHAMHLIQTTPNIPTLGTELGRFVESVLRSCEATFRDSDGYISYSKWWTRASAFKWDGNENAGYCHTYAEFSDGAYHWGYK